MKRYLAALVTALALPLLSALPAEASAGCVTPKEFFRQIEGGDSKSFVENRFDTRGYVYLREGSGNMVDLYKFYDTCRWSNTDYVDVNYDNYSYRGTAMKLYAAIWWHECRDWEDLGDGWFYCYDPWFTGEFYDGSDAERQLEKPKGFMVGVTRG